MQNLKRIILLVTLIGSQALPAGAQGRPADLAVATLEDLMKIEITSASRREQRAGEAPAAVYVIGRDEIRRSGMSSVPDLLRLVPGVQVAQINSNKWAVSVRGFNSLYSNKLLVMVDGRSVYNPAFSTVLWDTEDLMLEDIDRIEVIRGPGGALWGANAVNGVINIISRHSAETRGALVRATAGWQDGSDVAMRYGGLLGPISYRAFAQASSHEDSLLQAGGPANDHWNSITSGFRADWTRATNGVMVQGSVTSGEQRPLWINTDPRTAATGEDGAFSVSETRAANFVGRWTRTNAGGGALQVQTYFDQSHRSEAIGVYDRRTWDVDAQYHARLGGRHDIVGGGGYRVITESIVGRMGYGFTPDHARPLILNGFFQDAIALDRRFEVTLGAKYESNTFAGSGFQPTARVMWRLSPQQRVWGSVSRALRTPSIIDRGLTVEFPPMPMPDGTAVIAGSLGNPAFQSEHFVDAEAGYRINAGTVASIDVTGFTGRYDGLQTYEQLPPVVTIVNGQPVVRVMTRDENLLEAHTAGAEVSARVQLARAWEIDGTFSAFHLTPEAAGSTDSNALAADGNAPRFQWRLHSGMPLGPRAQADLHLFRVGALQRLDVPAYTRFDVRVEVRIASQLSAIVNGENLLQSGHVEFLGADTNMVATQMRRRANLQVAWRF